MIAKFKVIKDLVDAILIAMHPLLSANQAKLLPFEEIEKFE